MKDPNGMQNFANQIQGGAPPPPPAKAIKSDVQYIKCGVCTEAVKQLSRQVTPLSGHTKKHAKPSEQQIIDLAEDICDAASESGKWLKETRLKATDSQELKLVSDWEKETCGEDCATLALACSETFGEYALDAAELAYNGEKRSAITTAICREETNACTKKAPSLPKKHRKYKKMAKLVKEAKEKFNNMKKRKAAEGKTEL